MIYVPGKAGRLTFDAPMDACCNCGTSQHLSMLDTPLKMTRYFLLAGTEWRFTQELPYCRPCSKTATRFRTGLLHKLALAAIVFPLPVMVYVIAGPPPGEGMAIDTVVMLSLILALVLSFGYFSLRRAHAPQTSYCQPVALVGMKQKFSGEIVRLDLKFSNPMYAGRFRDRNAASIKAGTLTVRS